MLGSFANVSSLPGSDLVILDIEFSQEETSDRANTSDFDKITEKIHILAPYQPFPKRKTSEIQTSFSKVAANIWG